MKKWIIGLTLAMVISFAVSVPVYADDYFAETDATTTVTYTVEASYTVTIPPNATLLDNQSVDATVSVENVVIESGKQIIVRLADARASNGTEGFKVSAGPDSDQTADYTVSANGSPLTFSGINTVLTVNPASGSKTGSTTLTFSAPKNAKYAGTYMGTLTFTISVENVG